MCVDDVVGPTLGGHAECIAALIRAGAEPDCVGLDGHTAIYIAAAAGHATAVRQLAVAGATVTAEVRARAGTGKTGDRWVVDDLRAEGEEEEMVYGGPRSRAGGRAGRGGAGGSGGGGGGGGGG